MTLSISKLEKLISQKGFLPIRYYSMNDTLVYIEIITIENAETFMLYIPSKYVFAVPRVKNSYKLKFIDLEESFNTSDTYAGEVNEHIIENKYSEIDINISNPSYENNIGNLLEENYKHSINLEEIHNEDNKELKDIVRQLKRLRFCVKNVKYKISIFYKNYICTIKKDDSIECMSVYNYPFESSKKMFIVVDLELLYEKMDSLIINMSSIRKGLYHVLNKNHFTHSKTLERLLENKSVIIGYTDIVNSNKLVYETKLNEATKMLEDIKKSERDLITTLKELNRKNNNGSTNEDINNSYKRSSINSELLKINKIKEDLIEKISKVRNKREDTLLTVDKILFDNNVMIDCVIKNFNELRNLCMKG
jgi:hypothetical protein